MVSRFRQFLLVFAFASLALTGCASSPDVPLQDLFPPEIGLFLRTDGPYQDTEIDGMDVGIYQGPDGVVVLKVGKIGENNVASAVSVLPGTATNITDDPALGPRPGVFFEFSGEYHAAWGNGDWIFVISATSAQARSTFLGGYGF